MSGTNANILQSYNPNQQIGPDFGKMVANSQQLLQLRQQQQQVQQQNALLGVFQNPDAVDQKTGLPTADTLGKVTSINPQLGLQMRQNVLVSQDQQMKRDAMMGDEAAKNADRIADALSPVVENYQANIKGGMTPEQANQKASEEYKAAVDQLGASGFDPNRLKQAPPGWDPVKVPMLVERTKGFRDWQKEQLAAQKQDDLVKRYGQMGQQTMTLANGRTIVFRPGEPDPTKQYTYAGTNEPVDPKDLGNLTKTGTGGNKDQLRQQVVADVKKDPDFAGATDGEIGLEALRRMKTAGNGGSLADDPQALKWAADYFRQENKMPLGFRNQADQRAVIEFIAKTDKQTGAAPSDTIAAGATTAADTASMRRMTMQRDAIGGYEKGAEREFTLAQSLIPKTPEPFNSQLLTEWARTGERQFGNVPNAQFYTALTSALDEYAKVLSGGTGSASASTDSARRQALSIIPPGATTGQINGIIDVIKQTMGLKKSGYDDQIGEIQTRLRGSGQKPTEGGKQDGQTGQPQQGGYQPPTDKAKLPSETAVKQLKDNSSSDEMKKHFDDAFGPGAADYYLKPKDQSAPAKAAPSGQAQPAATPTGESQSATSIPPEGIPVPSQYASLPDGQTFGKGKYVKRGDRIYLNQSQGGDEFTMLQRARTALQQGAKKEDVEKQLRDAGVDPGKL
jgi:hypothetical protein